MRKTAGIMLIVLGVFSFIVPSEVANAIAWGRATSWDEYVSISAAIGSQTVLPTLLLIALIVGGGICALANGYYRWALLGAIGSVVGGTTLFLTTVEGAYFGAMYTPLAVLALIFLVKRRAEFEEDAEEEQEEEQV